MMRDAGGGSAGVGRQRAGDDLWLCDSAVPVMCANRHCAGAQPTAVQQRTRETLVRVFMEGSRLEALSPAIQSASAPVPVAKLARACRPRRSRRRRASPLPGWYNARRVRHSCCRQRQPRQSRRRRGGARRARHACTTRVLNSSDCAKCQAAASAAAVAEATAPRAAAVGLSAGLSFPSHPLAGKSGCSQNTRAPSCTQSHQWLAPRSRRDKR